MSIAEELKMLGQAAREAARPVARATAQTRTQAIQNMAKLLLDNREAVESANQRDMKAAH